MGPFQVVFPQCSASHFQVTKGDGMEAQTVFSVSKAAGIGCNPSTLSTLDYASVSLRDGAYSHSPSHFIKFIFNNIWKSILSCLEKLKSAFLSKKAAPVEERVVSRTLEDLKNLLSNPETPRESIVEAFRSFPQRTLFLQHLMFSYIEQRCRRWTDYPDNPWDKPLYFNGSEYVDRICQKELDKQLVFVPVVPPDRYDNPILRPHTTFLRVLGQMAPSSHREALLECTDPIRVVNTESLRLFAAAVRDFFAEEVEGRQAFKEEFKRVMDGEAVRFNAESLATNCLKEESFIIGFFELRDGERVESSGDPKDPLSMKYLSDHLFDRDGLFRTVLEEIHLP